MIRDILKISMNFYFFYQYKYFYCRLDMINKIDGCFDVIVWNINCKSVYIMGILFENEGLCD